MEDCVTCRGTSTIEIFSRRIRRFPTLEFTFLRGEILLSLKGNLREEDLFFLN